MGKQPGNKRAAARAFHELGRAQEQSEQDAVQCGWWQVPGAQMHEQLRAACHRLPSRSVFGRAAHKRIEAQGMPEILREQGVETFNRDLAEETVEPVGKRGFRETRRVRPVREYGPAKGILRLEPTRRPP